jgi:hypothetical protein
VSLIWLPLLFCFWLGLYFPQVRDMIEAFLEKMTAWLGAERIRAFLANSLMITALNSVRNL